MKVLLDTNIVLDYLGANQGFTEDAEKVFDLASKRNDIDKAFSRDWKDFEDAVQYTVAETNGVDCIITRNKNDFEENKIPSYTPLEFLEKFSL